MPSGKALGLRVVRRTLASCPESALIMDSCVWAIGNIAISATGAVNLAREIVALLHNAWSSRWLSCLLRDVSCENCANREVPGFGSASCSRGCESEGNAKAPAG